MNLTTSGAAKLAVETMGVLNALKGTTDPQAQLWAVTEIVRIVNDLINHDDNVDYEYEVTEVHLIDAPPAGTN